VALLVEGVVEVGDCLLCGRLPTGGTAVLKGGELALAAGLCPAGLLILRLLPLPSSSCACLLLLWVVPLSFWGVPWRFGLGFGLFLGNLPGV
jgi:hypothetical protein